MPTDAERREVARRLRCFVTDDSVHADVDACSVLHSIGLYYKDIDRIYFSGFDVARLADLMEPSFDRDELLALADEIRSTSCDNDGELTVDLIDVWGWSQAIREALGVADG